MNKKNKYLAYLEGWFSIVLNTVLFVLKYWIGIITNSVAIIADAWHTLSDSLTSIVVIAATRASSKPADKEHPFGHGRAELIASIIIGVLLSAVALNFIIDSINRLIERKSAMYNLLAIIIIFGSVLAKEIIAIFSFWAGKKTNSNLLIADGWHHQSDAISSIIILVGIFIGKYIWWIDGVLGIIISLFIFYTSYDILRQGINPLLGENPDSKLVRQVEEIASGICQENIHPHHFHMHKYGNHIELSFHIRLRGSMKLKEAHNMATEMENEIKKRLEIESTIHMEPDDTD